MLAKIFFLTILGYNGKFLYEIVQLIENNKKNKHCTKVLVI